MAKRGSPPSWRTPTCQGRRFAGASHFPFTYSSEGMPDLLRSIERGHFDRVLMARGRDATDTAPTTGFGAAVLQSFFVRAEEVDSVDQMVAPMGA